ncbi:Taurine hydroxylase-like protein SAT17 [Vanrija pseudolonga]|uniref:Taurine hydroxylase-like protein SAT17 n=1 Tax=Vanrija pseudolonga TaxID=143232 RepID=A0AAF1BI22_9TREE|nr:Taurine hydroxylase-like protein SAT17 [Vanrija pseudolonga]
MAPIATPVLAEQPARTTPWKPNVQGLTSGQHEPVFSLLEPYDNFPKQITGPTVWTREELLENPSYWKHQWTDELIAEVEEAHAAFEATGKPITAITKDTWHFGPKVHAFLRDIRASLIDGRGVALLQGLPVDRWSVEKSAAIYVGIGTVFGYTLSQNGKGHVLGHVKDLGNDPTQIHKVRIYSTAARQFFHADAGDIVGLLCLHRAKEGGESDIVSAHNLWNTIQAERPDVAEVLATPNWYFDRKGEQSEGQNGWVRKAVSAESAGGRGGCLAAHRRRVVVSLTDAHQVFYYYEGHVISHYDPYFVKSTGRYVEAGLIPALSEAQTEAIQVLEDTAQRLALHMILQVGDIQLLADTHVFHARTAFVDHAPPAPRRHLLRLWLSTPVAEGGWKRPFPDSDYIKRGGIQVNSQVETYPLDGE